MSGNKANYSSEVALDVFHTASLKEDYSNLKSFLKEGAYSDRADGHGQGKGFYVWTTLDKAVEHSEFLKGKKKGNSYVIFKFQEIIDAKTWDLDYEWAYFYVNCFISGNWDFFKKIPDDFLSFEAEGLKYFVLPSKSEKIHAFGESYLRIFLNREHGKHKKIIADNLDLGVSKGLRKPDYSLDAALSATIFNYLRKIYPKKTLRFGINLFEKFSKKGMGLKYVGKKPLEVKSFNLVIDGELLSYRKSKSYLRKHGIVI
jgi:hypothetical protein